MVFTTHSMKIYISPSACFSCALKISEIDVTVVSDKDNYLKKKENYLGENFIFKSKIP